MDINKEFKNNIKPCIWFDKNAEEAVNFYLGLFKNSKIENISYYGDNAHMPKGTVMVINFSINGQSIMALNGGPYYKLTPAFSLVVECDDQEEIDYYWNNLIIGGQSQSCGWVLDKFGLSWQIVPKVLAHLVTYKGPETAQKVMGALFKMDKLIIDDLVRAYES